MAAEILREREQIDYLRAKIRAAANASLMSNPNDEIALNIFRVLRRKLSLQDCERILAELPITSVEAEATDDQSPSLTTILTASDGQIVRHHHKSNKEHIDKERDALKKELPLTITDAPITIAELLSACPEATQFSLKRIETVHDVVVLARTLAPMIGITSQCYEAAHQKLGALRAAATVWAIMQFHDKIKAVGAYFRSITTGTKSEGCSPERLVRRLATAQSYAA
jgi:replication initiation protein RepC